MEKTITSDVELKKFWKELVGYFSRVKNQKEMAGKLGFEPRLHDPELPQ